MLLAASAFRVSAQQPASAKQGAPLQKDAKVLKEPGLQKLSIWLGAWKAESTDSAEAGKISAVSTGSWSADGDFLVVAWRLLPYR